MRLLARLLRVFGIAMVLMGLLWVGQGLGYIHWPADSFMLDQRPWALRGAAMLVVGVIFVLGGRWITNRR
jgi:hypothetical protein